MPKQTQTLQLYTPIFQNGDIAGDYYNASIEDSINRIVYNVVNPTNQECASAVNSKYSAALAIYLRGKEDAYTAYKNAVLQVITDLLLDLAGRGAWEAINEIIKSIWQSSNDFTVSAGVGGFSPDSIPPRFPNGVLVDGEWYPGASDIQQRRPYYDPILRRIVRPWEDYRIRPPAPPEPPPPKPPVPPVDPKTLEPWLKNNWGKIFGRVAIADLWGLILVALKKFLAPALVAAIVAAFATLAYALANLRSIYDTEIDRINQKIKELDDWKAKALECCARAKACGSSGNRCHTSITEEPQSDCP